MINYKNYILATLLILVLVSAFTFYTDFASEQKKYNKVRIAYTEKENSLNQALQAKNLSLQNVHVLLIAYKHEDELMVYVKGKNDKTYQHFKTYPICSKSGQLGPKNKQYDFQVPEGFYHINHYNPMSNYFLSLGINYPNQQDRKRSTAKNLGGSIYLHGSCVTIGCIPITDDYIKEIYVLAVQAKQNGQAQLPIYIFPFRFTTDNKTTFYTESPDLQPFWENLQAGYDMFEQHHKALSVGINPNGTYKLSVK